MKHFAHHSDKELISLVAQKNEKAFTELYHRYWQKLFAIAYNRLKERELAEDVVHDVFAGLWANSQLEEISSPENYLAVAVKYTVLGKLKKELKQKESFSAIFREEPAFNTIEQELHCSQVLVLLKKEVEELPEKCRLIFKYSRNDGMPVKQIATKLQLSPKTVENQLGKAMRHLRLATRHFFHLLAILPWLF